MISDFERAPPISEKLPSVFNGRPRSHSGRAQYKQPRQNSLPIQLGTFGFGLQTLSLEGGNLRVHLKRPIRMKLVEDSTFEILDWQIIVRVDDLPDLPSLLSRKFIELFSAAEDNRLTKEEKCIYQAISVYVDFKEFAIERASSRYVEGYIGGISENEAIVEWHDGTVERLHGKLAQALSELRRNDHFSALVKFGEGNRTVKIERIKLLPAIANELSIPIYASD